MKKLFLNTTFWLIVVSLIAMFLLSISLFNLKRAFFVVSDLKINFEITETQIKGINLIINANLKINAPSQNKKIAIEKEIELVQLKVYDSAWNIIGLWNGEPAKIDEDLYSLSIVFSSVEIFNKNLKNMNTESFKIQGFAKVRINLGREGLRINVPLEAEVLNLGKNK
ncbi:MULTISPECIES: hypothetical protein [Fervidobacterium]|uniref:Late embryogenesis abundant protein LEA-2 subgroup domain-containing protein n=1 Tax=Fervidobacterium nodosum (strain ATCC 35602 / DSM 5306 / Rt17-B1) TaxID=381764 RepID=A7HJD5_FERNB|nr:MULTISPECIES: hypothetical protein [Fervidobacterium]ABS60018.1 hypothetical protein Fnod_0151 [Fervidobacterium nodosum Rt17-B1]KAF2961262.1 hypothetical protein AS161_02420 [Fervidobacterium sp. 2310opik-2]HOJ94185.1 hypothetical protein [Fervidobacterium nodosum]